MQFTKSTIALVASLMATEAYALPAALTDKACGTTPAGTEPHQPLSSVNADTANACQAACTKDASCQSFAFGLPPQASAPECKLFGVAGAQVPKQDSNVMVFDAACSGVPTDKPTQASPIGVMHKARGEAVRPAPLATKPQEPKPQQPKPQETQPVQPKPEGPKARGEPVPPLPTTKPQGPKPKETKPPQPKLEGPRARGEPVPPPPPPPATKPQEPKPKETKPPQPKPEGPQARGEPIQPPPAATKPLEPKPLEPKPEETKPPQPKPEGPKARGEAKVCGAAPSGPAGRAPQPIKSDLTIATADACLALGKATATVAAVQFSQPVDGGAPHCSLFDVSANVLPPKDGAKFDLVFDIGC